MKEKLNSKEWELMKREAIVRMEMLNLCENVIDEFEEEAQLYRSEFNGILYWLDERQQTCVAEVQEDYNILVYHIIHSHTEFGELLSMLYVSRHKEEWEEDREFLKQGYPIAYVKNLSIPEFSEFGSIGIQPCIGGVKRIA